MQGILVICPTHRDHRELARLGPPEGTRFLFHDYASLAIEELVAAEPPPATAIGDPVLEIELIVDRFRGENLAGVVSTDDYPGSALASAVAARLGLAAPDTAVNLLCQHKHRSRRLQQAIAPRAVPGFALVDVHSKGPAPLGYPMFVKPVKSFFSVGARLVTCADELDQEKRRWADAPSFFQPFERLLEHYTGARIGSERLIAEAPLRGSQSTLEGFVCEGKFHLVGIVDSIMYPGTHAFARFEYPSSLPGDAQDAMADVAQTIMAGIGYDNGFFNIEFAYDAASDALQIVEINPRMASQFADLYEKVDGASSYELLIDLALGRSPSIRAGKGRFRMAASCVLRRFDNATVLKAPSQAQVSRVTKSNPDARVEVLVTPGRRLSQELQDGMSYRYAIVNLGGDDQQGFLKRLDDIVAELPFEFAPV